jgi:predicted TIM-barrel fold metal-dependent hydrolase
MSDTEQAAAPAASGRAGAREFIDTDIHEALKWGLRDLAPYLQPEWRRYVVDAGYTGLRTKYALSTVAGVPRADAIPKDGSVPGSDLDMMRAQLLDKFPVRFGVLTSVFFPAAETTQPELQAALASAYNDWQIENWLEKEPRLKGSICISGDPEHAAREIDRVAGHPGMVQVLLPVCPFEWGDERYDAIFAAAARHDLVVSMHVTADSRCAVPLPRYFAAWHMGYTQNYQAQLIGLITNGVFQRHPSLKVVMVEGGWTWLPHVLWRMDRDWRSLRIELPWLTRRPSEIMQEHVWMGTQPWEEPDDPSHFGKLIDMVGTDEFLVFATDYPHWDFDDPVRSLPKGLGEGLLRKIMVENALKLYSARVPDGR